MNVSRPHHEWNTWELAVLREEMTLAGDSVPTSQIIRNCQARLPNRSLASVEHMIHELRRIDCELFEKKKRA